LKAAACAGKGPIPSTSTADEHYEDWATTDQRAHQADACTKTTGPQLDLRVLTEQGERLPDTRTETGRKPRRQREHLSCPSTDPDGSDTEVLATTTIPRNDGYRNNRRSTVTFSTQPEIGGSMRHDGLQGRRDHRRQQRYRVAMHIGSPTKAHASSHGPPKRDGQG